MRANQFQDRIPDGRDELRVDVHIYGVVCKQCLHARLKQTLCIVMMCLKEYTFGVCIGVLEFAFFSETKNLMNGEIRPVASELCI